VGKRAATFTSESRGRPIRFRPATVVSAQNFAVLPTVRTALIRQQGQMPLKLIRSDLQMWVRLGKAPLTMLLIADVSASTYHFLEPAARIISILYRDAYRNRDTLGLIAIQKNSVHVINHPSRNLKRVLGNLTRLSPSGNTPLAEALEKALEVFKQVRQRQPFYNPVAILLSDCHPEPLTATYKNLFEEPAYQKAIQQAKLFRKNKIPIIVINPAHGRFSEHKGGELWWGTQLGIKIAQISGGKYHGIPHGHYEAALKGFDSETHKQVLWKENLMKRYIEQDSQHVGNMLLDYRDRPVDSFTGR